ncbi:hypothetical protein QAD02_010682 [Eretmocerus hayati]|uniref:Uncharacterized protein n=1 Tax=Eretmocerus hayati TaxID=131215 RepID=A0ACC2NVS5_9HYME|nr:hypothetical protein QAD02_010682 [Eretmocerus hayati]
MVKHNAWLNIEHEYTNSCRNVRMTVRRSAQQLRTYWNNTKSKVRKRDSELKRDRLITGGVAGTLENQQTNNLCDGVKSIVPTMNFTLANEWVRTPHFERDGSDDQSDVKENGMVSADIDEDDIPLHDDEDSLKNEEPTNYYIEEVTDNYSNLLVQQTHNKDLNRARYKSGAASGSLPEINLTKEEFSTYNEPHRDRTGHPTGMNDKVTNPADINKHRVAQPQQTANETPHKRSGASEKPGKTDAKCINSVGASKRCKCAA